MAEGNNQPSSMSPLERSPVHLEVAEAGHGKAVPKDEERAAHSSTFLVIQTSLFLEMKKIGIAFHHDTIGPGCGKDIR